MTTITALSDRFELVTVPRRHGEPSFGQEVAAGLRATPKRLSSKYLYDDVGSALFDAITRLPEYYPTRAETDILRSGAGRWFACSTRRSIFSSSAAEARSKRGS